MIRFPAQFAGRAAIGRLMRTSTVPLFGSSLMPQLLGFRLFVHRSEKFS